MAEWLWWIFRSGYATIGKNIASAGRWDRAAQMLSGKGTGEQDEKANFSGHGRRYGQPLRWIEADGSGGPQWRIYH